jgi:uncharacterized membrane protein
MTIKLYAATGTMMPPPNTFPVPASQERLQLGAWIDCGTP